MYDIIILGAGISGLLLASELSKKHKVLILEKQPSLPNNKYWLTDTDCIDRTSQFSECIDSKYDHMDFIAYEGSKCSCKGDYYLWNSDLLLNKLANIGLANNANIHYSTRFYSYSLLSDHIKVKGNDKEYSAKLLIDCMGYSSPLIYSKNLIKIIGYYFLSGGVLPMQKEINPIGLANISIDHKPKYLEIFPRKNGTAYVSLILADKQIVKSANLKSELDFIIRKSEYSQYFKIDNLLYKHLSGIVPVGIMKKRTLDRIYFFGESAQANPATTATAFTRMLYNYKEISGVLSECILQDHLSQENLDECISPIDEFNRKFQLKLFKNILEWNSDQFLSLILQMNKMDDDLINSIIFSDIHIDRKLLIKYSVDLLKNRNFFILKLFLSSFL
jgi:flavin-dependent dehydrogenase